MMEPELSDKGNFDTPPAPGPPQIAVAPLVNSFISTLPGTRQTAYESRDR